MDRSMMAMIYLVALLALFLILVIATIAVIVSKSRSRYDDYDEEDDSFEGDDESTDADGTIFEDADDMISDDFYVDNLDEGETDADTEAMEEPDDEGHTDSEDAYEEDEYEEDLELGDVQDADIIPTVFDPDHPNAPTQELDTDAVKKGKRRTIDSAFADVLPEEAFEETADAGIEDHTPEDTVETDLTMTEADEETQAIADVESTDDVEITDNDTADTAGEAQANDGMQLSDGLQENTEEPKKQKKKHKRKKEAEIPVDSAFAQPQQDAYEDSAFGTDIPSISLSNEAIAASVREAEAMGAAIMGDLKAAQVSAETMFGINEQLSSYGSKKNKRAKSKVSSDEEFYWYNKEDVADRPQRRPAENYYHYFNVANDCIEDLLVEMYDCALVRTEEIRYIAYGIEPRTLSMKEIMSGAVSDERKQKEPTTQDLVRIYEKWCGYVDHLFDKVEIHADEYTIEEIRKQLCEYGRNDVDILLEGK